MQKISAGMLHIHIMDETNIPNTDCSQKDKRNSKAADVQLNKTQCKTSENVKTKNCYPLTSIYAAMAALLDPEGSLSFFIASNMRSSSLITYIKKSH